MKHLSDAAKGVVMALDQGLPIEPGSPLHKRLKKELEWLSDHSDQKIVDAIRTLLRNHVTIDMALDLHDVIESDSNLSHQDKTTLHLAINVKLI